MLHYWRRWINGVITYGPLITIIYYTFRYLFDFGTHFFYIILYHIYMYNIGPFTYFLNFHYIKDADQSTSILIL